MPKRNLTLKDRETQKAYNRTPARREAQRARQQTPEYRAKRKALRETPEHKEKAKAYQRTPEHKAKRYTDPLRHVPDVLPRSMLSWYVDCPCPICGKLMGKPKRDHNHITNVYRAVICHDCNILLGVAHENTTILTAAIAYLKQYSVTPEKSNQAENAASPCAAD